jgi:hypothetical protein
VWTRTRTQTLHRSCGGHFSFYRDLIGRYWAGGADEKRAAPIHRLCTLARKMHVRSLIADSNASRPPIPISSRPLF